MKEYLVQPSENYTKTIKIDNTEYKCMSAADFKKIKKNNEENVYQIIGEVKSRNKKSAIGLLKSAASPDCATTNVVNRKDYNRLLYKVSGYVKVGDASYIALLKQRLLPLIVLVLVLVIGILAIIFKPNVPLPPIDENTIEIEETTTYSDKSDKAGGHSSLSYSLSAKLKQETGDITIYFRNEAGSNHDLTLQLMVESESGDKVIAESGRVPCGFGLYTLKYSGKEGLLQKGKYNAKYKLTYYDAKTGELSRVDANIDDVVLTVS